VKRTSTAYLLVILAAGASYSAHADVFGYLDEAGVMHYSNEAYNQKYERLSVLMAHEGQSNRAGAPTVKGAAYNYASHVDQAAANTGIDPALVHALITAESGYNPSALSRAGAMGLMQLMPQTAKRYGVSNAFDPQENIQAGTRYLRDLLAMFNGDLRLAIAAYNAGEHAVIKYGYRVPPYRETQAYVPKVLRLFKRYRAMV
jgi:soluble lytic murein transglycosylase-like protein